ncbi:MAG: trypsin-like peptidase domain-containing protein [Roseomonas sp.]|nr:trypsin-like peptidase domain-containing protein [Roseomonas sp.]MCA3393602.1 trypsin-like peptidase domain-containing protein [Roseomonas sp.]MCA3407905.1 trypsin-like peptidase domain-containing protein [Roseomonas sp.]
MAESNPNSGLEALPYTVVRIRAGDPSNAATFHSGTGFFYVLKIGKVDVALIVSNRHVLCGKTWIEIDFASADGQGVRIFGPPLKVRIEAGQLPIFEHPDPSVDLAAIPLNPLLEMLEGHGKKPHAPCLSRNLFIPDHQQPILHAATSVLMIGFPTGIMDERNNLPVVRRGTLATHYKADYLGETNFVVDIAAFGGSSGSPVFAFFENMFTDELGNTSFFGGVRLFFIGVLHSGPFMTANGTIVPAPVPTSTLIAQTSVMIHLGYCVKAFRVEELRSVIEAHLPK